MAAVVVAAVAAVVVAVAVVSTRANERSLDRTKMDIQAMVGREF